MSTTSSSNPVRAKRDLFARLTKSAAPPDGLSTALVICTLVTAVGTGAYLASSAVFFTEYVGLSAAELGVGFSLQAGVNFLANVPLGMLADRVGGRRSFILGSLALAGLFPCYLLVTGFGGFVAVAVLVGLCAGFRGVGFAKYIGDVVGADARVSVSAYLRSLKNIGLAVGTALAGVALLIGSGTGYIALIVANAVSFIIEAVLLWRLAPDAEAAATTPGASRGTALALRDRPFLLLSALNAIFMLNDTMLLVVLPLWILQRTDAPQVLISVTLIVNMVMTVLLQVRASRGAEGVSGAARAQRRAGISLAASCVVFAVSQLSTGIATIVILVLGVVLLTAGELLSSVASWGFPYSLASAERMGEYLALYDSGWKFAEIVGPAALIPLTLSAAPFGWLALAVLFVIGTVATGPVAAWAARTSPVAKAQATEA